MSRTTDKASGNEPKRLRALAPVRLLKNFGGNVATALASQVNPPSPFIEVVVRKFGKIKITATLEIQ
jgi:hypothetical protein